MCGVGAMHGVQNAQVVNTFSDVWKQVADLDAAFAVMVKLPRGLQQRSGRCELNSGFVERQWLPVVPRQQRFGFKRVDMRRPTLHKQKDDPFGSSGKMRCGCGQRIVGFGPGLLIHQPCQRQRTETDGR